MNTLALRNSSKWYIKLLVSWLKKKWCNRKMVSWLASWFVKKKIILKLFSNLVAFSLLYHLPQLFHYSSKILKFQIPFRTIFQNELKTRLVIYESNNLVWWISLERFRDFFFIIINVSLINIDTKLWLKRPNYWQK